MSAHDPKATWAMLPYTTGSWLCLLVHDGRDDWWIPIHMPALRRKNASKVEPFCHNRPACDCSGETIRSSSSQRHPIDKQGVSICRDENDRTAEQLRPSGSWQASRYLFGVLKE